MYLFEHKMFISSLLKFGYVHFELLDINRTLCIVEIHDPKRHVLRQDCNFPVLQIDHLVGIFHNRRGIGCKEIFPFTYAHNQG